LDNESARNLQFGYRPKTEERMWHSFRFLAAIQCLFIMKYSSSTKTEILNENVHLRSS
jgi:hypothetical protein